MSKAGSASKIKEIGNVCANLTDNTGKLMAGDDGGLAGIGVMHQVNIRTANTAGVNSNLNVIGSANGIGYIHIPHAIGAKFGLNKCFHDILYASKFALH